MSCLAITIILYYYRYYRTVVNILHNKRSKIPSKYHSEISRNSHKFKEVGPVHISVLGPSMALASLESYSDLRDVSRSALVARN